MKVYSYSIDHPDFTSAELEVFATEAERLQHFKKRLASAAASATFPEASIAKMLNLLTTVEDAYAFAIEQDFNVLCVFAEHELPVVAVPAVVSTDELRKLTEFAYRGADDLSQHLHDAPGDFENPDEIDAKVTEAHAICQRVEQALKVAA